MAGEGGGGGFGWAGFAGALGSIFERRKATPRDLRQEASYYLSEYERTGRLPGLPSVGVGGSLGTPTFPVSQWAEGLRSFLRGEQPDWTSLRAAPVAGATATALPVLRAAQPGAPPGTGSGVPLPSSTQPPPSGGTTLGNALILAQYIAEWIQRRKYIRALRRQRVTYSPTYLTLGGSDVPYFVAPSSGADYSVNLGAGLAGLGSGIASIISAIRGPSAMPGGMSFLPTTTAVGTIARGVGSVLTGAGIGAGISSLFGGCPSSEPFARSASSGVRAQTFFAAHPETGRLVWFRPAGRPLLWSGDLSAARRVRKIAGRARRRVGGR